MKRISCIIIEDEPLAVDVMKKHIEEVSFLELMQVFNNAVDALNYLQKTRVDLIFLDVHLPKLDGLSFLKTLHTPPKVIITTAYHEYALQGYEFNVLDYLMKPISFSRFLTAVNKLNNQPVQRVFSEDEPLQHPGSAALFFNVKKKRVKVELSEVLYIESQREYVHIFLNNQTIITKIAIHEIENLLPKEEFIRIHRSFIVSKNKITAYTLSDVEVAGKSIPIGRSYKELIQSVLEKAKNVV